LLRRLRCWRGKSIVPAQKSCCGEYFSPSRLKNETRQFGVVPSNACWVQPPAFMYPCTPVRYLQVLVSDVTKMNGINSGMEIENGEPHETDAHPIMHREHA
jgi:hypothetical protein